MILPDELIFSIVDYIAYKPTLPNLRSVFKCASPELLALSVADWRLRRICLPFLFANLKIWHIMDAERLEEHLPLCSRFTKILFIGEVSEVSEAGIHIITQNLCRLERLSHVKLRDCHLNTVLLRALLMQPSVISVLIHDLPDKSLCDTDLSKVILSYGHSVQAFSSDFEKYLERGMTLECMKLDEPHLFVDQFGSKVFPGLKKISIDMGTSEIVSFSFLSVLLSSHPSLHEIWTYDEFGFCFYRHTPPFLSSFIEQSQRLDLTKTFQISAVGLCRVQGPSSHEWSVMGLTARISESVNPCLIRILNLIATSFPKLEFLALDLESHQATYYINDFVTAIAQFSSLKQLYLDEVYHRLDFGSNQLLSPVRQVEPTDVVDALYALVETGILWYTSRLAREARSLDTVYVSNQGSDYSHNDNIGVSNLSCHLSGWFHTLNDIQDVSGTLRRDDGSEVYLETRMLPPGFI
ncbi:hypothetical protein EV361DRAFT_389409 [Lentinula raphanica]|uniref:Uncharacterized protein n=1 Tax=Lentinula raphanica TaxID=153919 RepID=A0AA38P2Z5_9AGAR|nr:hypothetical protein F5880DRAFT_1049498 [Lentinula raphanica]KAJ3835176.1 hypothetical protein F5878DRAFT_664110 [Lentinula raphanica]KAJ3968825.1 hypothetical protein EV361DRAFT_389409 [Lentinula raphanica]